MQVMKSCSLRDLRTAPQVLLEEWKLKEALKVTRKENESREM